MRRTFLAGLIVLSIALPAYAWQAKTDAEVADESKKAGEFLAQNHFAEALPLYEELHTLRPANNFYREQLSRSLFGVVSTLTDKPDQAKAMLIRARQLLLDAQKSGDNSPYLQIMLEKTAWIEAAANPPKTLTPAQQVMRDAEKAFASGKLDEALELYKKVAELDPRSYEARLFAGDTAYKKNDFSGAGEWYAKAIAIDPDRETAYRYWGDALYHDGKVQEAKSKYIDAIVAYPYQKTPWVGLQQWAQQQKVPMWSPSIKLPQGPIQDPKNPGNTNITIDPSTLAGGGGAAWVSYPITRTVWLNKKFKEEFPKEKQYRHTLAEEVDALNSVILSAKGQKVAENKMDNNLKQLIALQKDGMLESWVLLNNADQGILQDYPAYRDKHRDVLHAYIEKYVLHPSGQ